MYDPPVMADLPSRSRPPVNVDLIRHRAKEIRDGVAILERYARLPVEEFLARGEYLVSVGGVIGVEP